MYLFTDTETGGIDPKTDSLLSAAFILTDDSGKVLDTLVLKCKPKNAPFVVNEGALAVNKINLVEHAKVAQDYVKCAYDLLGFLNKHAISKMNTTLVGHRLDFDLGFLKNIMDDTILRNYFRKYTEDTSVIGSFLRIPFGKLADLADSLKVDTSDLDLHTELGDAELTRRIYFKMFDMVHGDVNGQETHS